MMDYIRHVLFQSTITSPHGRRAFRRLTCFALLMSAGLAAASLQAAEIDLKSLQPLEKKTSKYGPYVGVFGGVTTGQQGRMRLNYAGHSLDYDILDSDGNAVFGLEVGYAWRTKYLLEFAMEFEAMYSSTEVTGVLSNQANTDAPLTDADVVTAKADMSYASFLLNGVIALDLRKLRPRIGTFLPRFRPYMGGGIGGAQIWFRNQSIQSVGDVLGTPTAPSASPFNIDEFVFAYQVFGGMNVHLTSKLDVYAEYRKLTFEKTNDLSEFSSEMVVGGLQFKY
jgi:opacity protein-like surface antigen